MTNDTDKKNVFAANLNRFLVLKDMTGATLADLLEVGRSTVTYWRQGKFYPTMERIEQMAKIFGCRITDLIEPANTNIKTTDIADEEYAFIERFRKTDDKTKEMIDRLLSYAKLLQQGGDDNEKP